MATSIRLPDTLKARAASHADGLGISLNALIAVALSDYLDARTLGAPEPVPEPEPEPKQVAADPVAQGEERTAEPVPNASPAPKPGRNAPCPCGSGRKYKVCCGRG